MQLKSAGFLDEITQRNRMTFHFLKINKEPFRIVVFNQFSMYDNQGNINIGKQLIITHYLYLLEEKKRCFKLSTFT